LGYYPRMVVALPSWNARGVINPINPLTPADANRSPYAVSLVEFIDRFAITAARARVLQGYLQYRAELHAAGLLVGFQWLDGSFLEDIETIEKRDPADIDVVTFYEMPVGQTQLTLMASHPGLFPANAVEHDALKKRLCVDAYVVQLDAQKPTATAAATRLVRTSAYWYSMWSHRRDLSWKGYVQVDLSAAEDAQASTKLAGALALLASTPTATAVVGAAISPVLAPILAAPVAGPAGPTGPVATAGAP